MSIETERIVLHEESNLTLKEIKTVSESQATLQELYGDKIFKHSMNPDDRIDFIGAHSVFNGYVEAYKDHRPITISPDIFWLLIVQGFAHHVNNNAEELRPMFVDFQGEKHLTVERSNITPQTATVEDWHGIFGEFAEQISIVHDYDGRYESRWRFEHHVCDEKVLHVRSDDVHLPFPIHCYRRNS